MKIIFLFTIVCLSFSLNAQHLTPKVESNLEKLLLEIKIDNGNRLSRVNSFINDKKISSDYDANYLNKKGHQIFDVQNGQPLFRKSFNNDAAAAMEVDAVRPGGELGLFLEGENMNIGIWDGGLIRTTHEEFKGRIKYFDGAAATSFSNHSTGVAGTLLGSGLNIASKGMAPLAEGIAYDFNNDTEEMVESQTFKEIVVSNHSYGLITGWNDGQWYGDSDISDEEDWRFGFYDNNAKTWDDIAFASPKYLIVKSAGNDRGDSGNGSFPSDGPYDTVAGASTSKNVLIVGAARKSTVGYDSPQNIKMSTFSGWGPTDDGRIKPDIVSIGVDILTSGGGADNDYQTTNGTSFSSPAACGGLALVQELNKSLSNTFLTASALKSLAIHTANQTGDLGPDYRFGWGLLNIKKACNYLLNKNQSDKQIFDATLQNGETLEYEINPKENTSVKVTIVWTDPSGNPVASSLDPVNSMLVNDLDVKISDENNNIFFPYILDPNNPSLNAKTGDNFRDNVEQVFIKDAEERTYTVSISHKSTLQNLEQNFSIIIDYESSTSSLTNLFWINGSGNWSDSNHWSLTSGGSSAGLIPSGNYKIVVDDNSLMQNDVITCDSNSEIGAISVFTKKKFSIDLNDFSVLNRGAISMASDELLIKNGTIIQNSLSSGEVNINLNETKTENLKLEIASENNAAYKVQSSNINLHSLDIKSGNLIFDNVIANIDSVISNESALNSEFSLLNSELNLYSGFDIRTLNQFTSNRSSVINVNSSLGDFDFNIGNKSLTIPVFVSNSVVNLYSNESTFMQVSILESDLNIIDDVVIESLDLDLGCNLELNNNTVLSIQSNFNINSTINQRSMLIGQNSTISINYRDKLCFDFLDISNVNHIGPSTIAVGNNSTVDNSEGWIQNACGEVIFSDYDSEFLCLEGISQFSDLSQGNVDTWGWWVDGENVSSEQNLSYAFGDIGQHEVVLIISDNNGNTSSYNTEVLIVESTLEPNRVIESNPTTLASLKSADSYQWFKNDEMLVNENDRIYKFNGELAAYYVLTFDNECNRKSEILDLTTSLNDNRIEDHIKFYPNPVSEVLIIDNNTKNHIVITIINSLGQKIETFKIGSSKKGTKLDLSSYESGSYLIHLVDNELSSFGTIIIE